MPSTFGCGQKASLTPDRRPPPNSSIYEISTNLHAENCRPLQPSVAWTSATSLHRSHSAPANHASDSQFEPPSRPISGNERSKHFVQAKRYSPRSRAKLDKHSSTRRWISSHPINCIYTEPQGLFGKTTEYVSCCEGSCSTLEEKQSFHHIYGPSLQFRPSSHDQSTIALEDLMMLDVDADVVAAPFKDTDSRGNRGKKTSSHTANAAAATLSDAIYRDGDGAHNVCARKYSRERSKQKHRYAESNSDIAHSVDTDKEGHKKHLMKRDLEAKGDELQRKGRTSSKRHSSSSPRHARIKPESEYVAVHDGDDCESDFPRIRGGGSSNYQQNHVKSDNTMKTCLEDALRESPDDQRHTTAKQMNSNKTTHDRSPSRRLRTRQDQNVRKQYDAEPPVKMEPLDEVEDVEAGMNYAPTHNESQESGETCLEQQWMSSTKEKKDLKNKEQKAKNPDASYDIPFAELSQEWMRFRNAEESGDWVASEDEESMTEAPPMLRFMKFLGAQYANRARDRGSQSSHSQENVSQVDLTTLEPFDVSSSKGRGEGHNIDQPSPPPPLQPRPTSTAAAYACPERMYGGASHYPSASNHPPHSSMMPSANKVFPSQGKSPRKKDVPLWEHLTPAMQVEHAAVITNQLCRAMALQAAQQQRRTNSLLLARGGDRSSLEHKSPSSESRVSRSTEHRHHSGAAAAAVGGGGGVAGPSSSSLRNRDAVASSAAGVHRCPSEESDPAALINEGQLSSSKAYVVDAPPRDRGRIAERSRPDLRHQRDRNRSRFRHYSRPRRQDERLDRVWFDNEIPKAAAPGAGVTPLRGGGASGGSPCGRPCCPCPNTSRAGDAGGSCGMDRQLLSERCGGGGGGLRGGRGTGSCTCRDGVPIAVFNFTECAATFQQYMRSGDACGDDDGCECE